MSAIATPDGRSATHCIGRRPDGCRLLHHVDGKWQVADDRVFPDVFAVAQAAAPIIAPATRLVIFDRWPL